MRGCTNADCGRDLQEQRLEREARKRERKKERDALAQAEKEEREKNLREQQGQK